MTLTLVRTYNTFSQKIQRQGYTVTIYAVRKQSRAPYIHEGKDFPNRLCIKQSQCVKIILHCSVTGWSDLSVLLCNRVKVKPVAQSCFGVIPVLNCIQEKHLLFWLLTEHTAVTICQYPGCKSPDSQYTYPCWWALNGFRCPRNTRHTLVEVSKWEPSCLIRLPVHWHLSNKHDPSIWRTSPYV